MTVRIAIMVWLASIAAIPASAGETGATGVQAESLEAESCARINGVARTACVDINPRRTRAGIAAGSLMRTFTGSYHVTEDNAVVSNLVVHGDIVIDARNVTLKNVKLVSGTRWHALTVTPPAKGFTLEDSEIDGRGSTVNAVYGFGTFLRNDLHHADNGINVTGPAMIRENFIHDLRGDSDAHYDGIEINGGFDISIVHNIIVNDHEQTSAVMMNNEFGGLNDITIEGNRLIGGGYTVYLDGRKGGGVVDDASIRIINNQIGRGRWGDFAFFVDRPVVGGNTGLETPGAGD